MNKAVVFLTVISTFSLVKPALATEFKLGSKNKILISVSPGFLVQKRQVGKTHRIEISQRAESKSEETVEIKFSCPRAKGLILPKSEGHYIPTEDKEWTSYLCNKWPSAMTGEFSFPAWGYDFHGKTATVIVTNQFDNEVSYHRENNKISIRVKHTFTSLSDQKRIGFTINYGGPSLLSPALTYRRLFLQKNPRATLLEKIRSNPRVSRLIGAPHAYLWGDWILAQHNIKNWRKFCRLLANSLDPLWKKLSEKGKKEIKAVVRGGAIFAYRKLVIIEEIDKVLKSPSFIRQWKPDDKLASCLESKKLWGAGVSQRMLKTLAKDGFKKFALFLGDINAGANHPKVALLAKELGYLYGPYDSYHSVHHPSAKETWPTAQFDMEAYQKGAMKRADGSYYHGFKKIGRKINPEFALPYMKKRVNSLLAKLQYTNWFIDCDAYGELHNDYSPAHPLNQEKDAFVRTQRMKWLSDELGLVVSSEGGVGYSIPGIHAAHGMMTPVFGFSDPDMRTKGTKHYLGTYWPPDGPHIMVKQVPLKAYYYKFHYDPRYRLPLYQAAFHDCIVTTHHWSYSTLKFKETVTTNELCELLYNVPPLYHLNNDTYERYGERMRKHCSVFTPLHERLALKTLKEFSWLTENRLVQQVVYSDGTKLIANFGKKTYKLNTVTLAPLTFIALKSTGEILCKHTPLQ